MRSGVGLCVLALLCLHSSVLGQEAVESGPVVPMFCDNPVAEKAASNAVHKFNEKLSTGYKLALFQIHKSIKKENSSGSVYELQFTSRRSDCLAGSDKPWTDCDYLPYGRKKPLLCNATVFMTEAETHTETVDCLLDDYVVSEKADCLGCPVEIDENSEDLNVPLSVSISKYNSISDSTHLFTLHTIGHATRQVVAGFRFKVRFDMRRTTCAKDEHKDLNELCVPDEKNVEYSNCNSTVDVAPWRLEPPQAQMQCEPGQLPPTVFTRRRPPGWSPLRNFLLNVRPSAPAAPPPQPTGASSQSPSQAAAKEESSEEDATGTKPSASPAEAAKAHPLHCPSKPWKPFNPVAPGAPGAPTEATVEVGATPSTDGVLSDTDLLG